MMEDRVVLKTDLDTEAPLPCSKPKPVEILISHFRSLFMTEILALKPFLRYLAWHNRRSYFGSYMRIYKILNISLYTSYGLPFFMKKFNKVTC